MTTSDSRTRRPRRWTRRLAIAIAVILAIASLVYDYVNAGQDPRFIIGKVARNGDANANAIDCAVCDLNGSRGTDFGELDAQSDDVNKEFKIPRDEQDRWAARSHQRAEAATEDGRFAEEIVPLELPQRKGDPITFERDEGIRPGVTAESLAKLKPVFQKDGTITAGNASQISNGGAAVVVMSEERAQELGIAPLAEIVAHGMSADAPPYLHTVPALAIQSTLKKAGASPNDLDLVEINEAFAAVALHSTRMLFDGGEGAEEKVNVNGGAVALGHPIGCTGARLAVTLLHELERRGGGLGAAALCGGPRSSNNTIFQPRQCERIIPRKYICVSWSQSSVISSSTSPVAMFIAPCKTRLRRLPLIGTTIGSPGQP